MAVCDHCTQDMLTADGCIDWPVAGKSAIKRGDPNDSAPGATQRCHDCNALPGHYHHPGCDMQRCPCCGGQLLACNCEATVTAATLASLRDRIEQMLERARRKQEGYPEKHCGPIAALAHIRWVEDLEELQTMVRQLV